MNHDKNKERIANRAVEIMRVQDKSLATQKSYRGYILRYYDFCLTLPREWTPEQKFERFLTHLAVECDLSSSACRGAFFAVLFLYNHVEVREVDLRKVNAMRSKRPVQIRKAPSEEDVRALLEDVLDVSGYPTRLVVKMLYGSGLRVSEPIALRRKEVRLERRELYILNGKGGKDRVVRLPEAVVEQISEQMIVAETVWRRDKENGVPVALPNQLGRKYPEYRFAKEWSWVFPLHTTSIHPITGEVVRYHMLPSAVQKAVKESRRRLDIQVVAHELRHGYATHVLDHGGKLKALQQALGHSKLETTGGYCHADALSVESPLDAFPNVIQFSPQKTEIAALA